MKRESWLLLKKAIFSAVMFPSTVFMAALFTPVLLMPRHLYIRCAKYWFSVIMRSMERVFGLRCTVKGLHNLPKTGHYIVVSNHSSHYECLILGCALPRPVFILKKQLLYWPILGGYFGRMIHIDRKQPLGSLRKILAGIKRFIANSKDDNPGYGFIIFPQGSRSADNSTPFKEGVAAIYQFANLPIIPVAVNSGQHCPHSLWNVREGGEIVAEFMPAIETGSLGKRAIAAKVERIITRKLTDMGCSVPTKGTPADDPAG